MLYFAVIVVRNRFSNAYSGFNPTGNDWEYFMLAGDGQIAMDSVGNKMRGANLMKSLSFQQIR